MSPAAGPALSVLSFSFKRGLPEQSQFVFDMRFLNNPFYIPALQSLTGLDKAVGEHIESDRNFTQFFAQLSALLEPLLPLFPQGDGMVIAFGCTGGQHRSVYTAEKCAAWLRAKRYDVTVHHRDLP